MKTIARVLLTTAAAVLIAGSLHAEEPVQRFIVVLKQRSSAVPDVASLGGNVELQQDDQLVVTIPPGALAALKADPKVRYVEQVGGTPSDDETPLIGVPSDPRPGPASQPARFAPHALGSLAWDSGTYGYDGAGNIVSIGTDNYLYDGVQRLRQSSTQGTPETYTYDGFGNMKTRTNTIIPAIQPSTNRYMGYGYNEIGAVTSDGSYVFSYDALGQPLSKIYNNDSSKLEYYIYTPGDERIGVQRAGWWTWSVRAEGGKVLRQYKSSSTNPSAPALWLEDFIWRDGLLLGSQRPAEMGGRRHFHLDHLGSPRLVTADNGQMVSYHDYYPFGDEHSPVSQEVAGGFDREEPMKFTGHERDYAGGMGGEDGHAVDDMHARYYSLTIGRFMTVDSFEGDLRQPQSWNRYAYVLNNPVNFYDAFGLSPLQASGSILMDGDCPKDTDLCVEVHGHVPDPPQLPPSNKREPSFWVRAPEEGEDGYLFYKYMSWGHKVGDPILRYLNGGCGHVVQCGTVAFGNIASAPMSELANIQDAELANIVDENYRPNARYGDGGTADSIRHEIRTGELLSPSGHASKAREMIAAIGNIMKKGRLNAAERAIAIELATDLIKALMGN